MLSPWHVALVLALLPLPLVACDTGASGPPDPPPAVAARIEEAGGDGQEGRVGTQAVSPLTVRVESAAGAPVSGVSVRFDVVSGAAELLAPDATTGADGMASTGVRFGITPGPVVVHATSSGLAGSPVAFTLTARPAPFPSGVLVDFGTPVADFELDRARGWLYASLSVTREVVAVALDGGGVVGRVTLDAEPAGLSLGAAGDRLYVAVRGDGTVRVLDPATLAETRRVHVQQWTGHPWTYDVLEVAPGLVAVSATPQSSALADLALVDFSASPATGGPIDGDWSTRNDPFLHRSRDGQRLYVAEPLFPGILHEYDLTTAPPARRLRSFHDDTTVRTDAVAASGSGARLYFPSGHVVDAQTLSIVARLGPGVPSRDPAGALVYMAAAGGVGVYSEAGEVRTVAASYRVPRRAEAWDERGALFVLSCASHSDTGYAGCDRIYSVSVD